MPDGVEDRDAKDDDEVAVGVDPTDDEVPIVESVEDGSDDVAEAGPLLVLTDGVEVNVTLERDAALDARGASRRPPSSDPSSLLPPHAADTTTMRTKHRQPARIPAS